MGIARSEKRGDKGIANALREKLQETDMVREREKNVNNGREWKDTVESREREKEREERMRERERKKVL